MKKAPSLLETGFDEKIPSKIHFVFLSKTEYVPELFDFCIERTTKLNPEWDIKFYNEDDALDIINENFPQLIKLYNSYALNVQRADMIRIIIIYLYGGFYLDMDMYCLKGLDGLRKFNLVLGEEKYLEKDVANKLGLLNQQRVANYMFGSIPKHPFWSNFLDRMIEKSTKEIKTQDDVLESTGPGLLTDYYHESKNLHQDITILKNIDRVCVAEGHNQIACHFGNYAAHLHLGTWRQNGKNSSSKSLNNDFHSPSKLKLTTNSTLKKSIFFVAKSLKINTSNIYNGITDIAQIIDNCSVLSNEKILFIDSLETWLPQMSKNNCNIFYSTDINARINYNTVDIINEFFNYIIVPSEQVANCYIEQGVKRDIRVIASGFKRYARNFEKKSYSKIFTLGCFSSCLSLSTYQTLISTCKYLNEFFPIKLKLYDPGGRFFEHCDKLDCGADSIIEVEKHELTDTEISNWFIDITCILFLSEKDSWQLSVLESLYMGIPAIVLNMGKCNSLFDDAINSAIIYIEYDSDLTKEKITNAIEKLYNNREYYHSSALKVARLLEDKYTIEEMQQNILDFLNAI